MERASTGPGARGCGKVRYYAPAAAEAERSRLRMVEIGVGRASTARLLRVYYCGRCSALHVGHSVRARVRAEAGGGTVGRPPGVRRMGAEELRVCGPIVMPPREGVDRWDTCTSRTRKSSRDFSGATPWRRSTGSPPTSPGGTGGCDSSLFSGGEAHERFAALFDADAQAARFAESFKGGDEVIVYGEALPPGPGPGRTSRLPPR